MDTALLTSAETNNLAVLRIADRVGLGVFQGDGGNGEIAGRWRGESRVFGSDDAGEGVFWGDFGIVAMLC